MPLLASSAALKLAIRSLDPVVATFPNLVAARAARAGFYHRLWLNTAPVQVQRFRAARHTYASRFVPSLSEGIDRGDVLALHRARRGYAEVLEREEIPGAMANLALLESYSRRGERAERRARRAAALSAEDVGIHNNLGVVLALSGDFKAAQPVFDRAGGLAPDKNDPALAFNRAKIAALLRTPDRALLLENYLRLDSTSGWSNEARRLLGVTPSPVLQYLVPVPEVQPGVALGTGPEQTMARLGPSRDHVTRNDLLVLQYPKRGLRLVFSRRRGAILIELLSVEAGAVHGVRVGDPVGMIGDRWGHPSERGTDHLVYWIGRWGIGVEYDRTEGRIDGLSLASA